jgi:hypothetical protein
LHWPGSADICWGVGVLGITDGKTSISDSSCGWRVDWLQVLPILILSGLAIAGCGNIRSLAAFFSIWTYVGCSDLGIFGWEATNVETKIHGDEILEIEPAVHIVHTIFTLMPKMIYS